MLNSILGDLKMLNSIFGQLYYHFHNTDSKPCLVLTCSRIRDFMFKKIPFTDHGRAVQAVENIRMTRQIITTIVGFFSFT